LQAADLSPRFAVQNADDYYNYAVSMVNQGNHEEAELNLGKALKLAPKSDYIYYALAATHALREILRRRSNIFRSQFS